LGIDAGGTYTDAVIYDFEADRVLGKGKGATTKWDFTLGIGEALDQLDEEMLREVGLVSVSTTLATNAIVEGRGQKVALVVLPPFGRYAKGEIGHEPTAVVQGMLDIEGRELAPIDREEIRRVGRELAGRGDIGGFAVSGFAGTVNPAHELAVKDVLREETGLTVTCGHELSVLLDFQTRARTAVLNARIIPELARFLAETEGTLQRRGITGPMMVVKGDGTLMSAAVARERPVETILSGPAASVAGATYLTGREEATVVDMGGTTTDTAKLSAGKVRTCVGGTWIGGWRTHVRALEMRTVGLGGDSLVGYEKRELVIGPRRVGPISWAGSKWEGTSRALAYLERNLDAFDVSTRGMEIVGLAGWKDRFEPTEDERKILSLLGERPFSVSELAERIGGTHWTLLRLDRLEAHHAVQRCGLTPTDVLHARGEFDRWDRDAAERICAMFARIAGVPAEVFIEDVIERVIRRLAVEVLKKQIDGEAEADDLEECAVCGVLVDKILGGGAGDYAVKVELRHPVIGIGAPVHCFLGRAARRLGAEVIIPADADVANAIGAITSKVEITRGVEIRPDERGRFAVEGVRGAPVFRKLGEAHAFAVEALGRMVREEGRAAGTEETQVEIGHEDHILPAADGTELFLRRTVTARLRGAPSG